MVLLVSSRGGFKIVQKAARSKYPAACVDFSPSSLAVQMARERSYTCCSLIARPGIQLSTLARSISVFPLLYLPGSHKMAMSAITRSARREGRVRSTSERRLFGVGVMEESCSPWGLKQFEISRGDVFHAGVLVTRCPGWAAFPGERFGSQSQRYLKPEAAWRPIDLIESIKKGNSGDPASILAMKIPFETPVLRKNRIGSSCRGIPPIVNIGNLISEQNQ